MGLKSSPIIDFGAIIKILRWGFGNQSRLFRGTIGSINDFVK